MDNRFAEMVRAIRLLLEDESEADAAGAALGGGVKPQDNVVILCSTDNYPPLVEAYFSAVSSFGAEVLLLRYKARPPLVGLPDEIVDAASQADVVIDLSGKTWAYTESHDRFLRQLRDRGGRMMLGQTFGWEEDVATLISIVPDPEVKERTARAKVFLDKAQTVRLTSSLGTDLVVQRGDTAELVTFAPAGQVAFGPPTDGVDGVIYYQGGFRIQFPDVIRRMVFEPVRIEISMGKIVDIARDTGDGIMLHDWFRSHNDPNSYQFAHINLGLDRRIKMDRLDNVAVHFNYGATLVAFGTNYTPLFGTTVRAKSHIDMNYTGGDYWVDDLCLVRAGEFTDESDLRGPFT